MVFISLYLFTLLDADASGTLDKFEVFIGVEQYCEAREIGFDSRVISQLWEQVDENGDGVLDRREFAVFLARYCEAVGVGLDDMAFVVLEQLAGVAMTTDAFFNNKTREPDSAWAKFMSLTRKKPKRASSWAQLKVDSEEILETTGTPSGGWDTLKDKLSNSFSKS